MSYQPRIRLFVEHALNEGTLIPLHEKQAHYLTRVMRLKLADRLYVFNGREGEWLAEIASIKKRGAELRLISQHRAQITGPDVWLLFAPVKQGAIDFLAQKATELGIARLVPVITERTNVSRVNTDRLRANAVEAAEQSERLSVPEITEPRKLSSLLGDWDKNRKMIFCDETGQGKPLRAVLENETDVLRAILIGPEGGFSDTEIETLHRLPYIVPVSLGPRILRADTAALAALACWQMMQGDWTSC